MGEGGVTATVVGGVNRFMCPGLGIVKSWQGIVELVLRTAVIILSLVLIAAGGSCQSSTSIPDGGLTLLPLTGSAGGWLMFIGFLLVIYEIVFIIQRFVNINLINQHITIVLIIDMVVSFVMAALIFCGAVALATYIPQWISALNALTPEQQFFRGIIQRIITASEATTAFGFITMFVLIGLGVFVLLGGLIFKWEATTAKYK